MADCPEGEYRVPELPAVPMPLSALLDSGLLWKINRDLLHPIGLALAAGKSTADPDAVVLDVRVAADGVWEFAPGLTKSPQWQAWYAERRAQMTDAR